jgi:hypothetical protein
MEAFPLIAIGVLAIANLVQCRATRALRLRVAALERQQRAQVPVARAAAPQPRRHVPPGAIEHSPVPRTRTVVR